MNEPSETTARDEETLAVPGVLCVRPGASGRKVISTGWSAGWMMPRGLMGWEHEIACIARADAGRLAGALKATLPHEQIAPKRFPMAKRAAEVCPLLALTSNLAAEARGHGVRVHTVGVDRVSAGFYYFAEGGRGEGVRAQGNLIEMLAPSLGPSSTNAEIQSLLDSLIDRLVRELSGGILSEIDLELCDALPRMAKDGTGLVDTDIEAFDKKARALALEWGHWDTAAHELVAALTDAEPRGLSTAPIPMYGEARREARSPLRVKLGEKVLVLPAQSFWTVTGSPRENAVAPVATPPTAKVAEKVPAPAPRPAVSDRSAHAGQGSPPAPVVTPKPTTPVSPPVRAALATERGPAAVLAPGPASAARPEAAPALTPSPTRVLTSASAPAPASAAALLTAAAPTAAAEATRLTATAPAPAREAERAALVPREPAQERTAERKSIPAEPIDLVRPRSIPGKPGARPEPPPGNSLVTVLLVLVALAIAYFVLHNRHLGRF